MRLSVEPPFCVCQVQEEVLTMWARRVDILPQVPALCSAWDSACFQAGTQKYMTELPLN